MGLKVNGTDIPNGSEFYVNGTQVQEAYCNGILIWWFNVEPPDEKPTAITDFNASDNLTGRVKVTYTSSPNATEHDLYRDGSMVKDKVTSGYEDVIAAGTYTYYVKAQNSMGDTDSNTDNGTSLEEQGGTPPSTINNFAASDDIENAIIVTFTHASGDPTPTHDLIRVSNGSIIASNIFSGYSWATNEQNVLLRVDAKNTEGTSQSNTDYGSAKEDTPVGEAPGYISGPSFVSTPGCYKIVFSWDAPDSGTPPFTYTITGDNEGVIYTGQNVGYTLNITNECADTWSLTIENEYGQYDKNVTYIAGFAGVPNAVSSFNASDDRSDGVMLNIGRPSNISCMGGTGVYKIKRNGVALTTIEDAWYEPSVMTYLDTTAASGTTYNYEATYATHLCGYESTARSDSGSRIPDQDPPGQQIFTTNGTFFAPYGYGYVDLCMVGSAGVGGGTDGNNPYGGGAGQIINTAYGVSSGEAISVLVAPMNSGPGSGTSSFFGSQGAGGGDSAWYYGSGNSRTTCGGTKYDGNRDGQCYGGQSSGFGNGGSGWYGGTGAGGGVGSGGGAGGPGHYGGTGGRGEVRVYWGMNYWDLIPGYNDMNKVERWIAILKYNEEHNIPFEDVFKSNRQGE